MAIQTTTINDLPDYTDAQMVKLIKYALVNGFARGQSYTVNGRTMTSAGPAENAKLLDFFEQRVAASTGDGFIALGELRGP